MSNIYGLDVKGWMPFNILWEASENLVTFFAVMSTPTAGFKIEYKRKTKYIPHERGKTHYTKFRLHGSRAMWSSRIMEVLEEMVELGTEIESAYMVDVEGAASEPGSIDDLMKYL